MIPSCLACKQRKVKCERGVPSCQNCIKATKTCFYPTDSARLGSKSRSKLSHSKKTRDQSIDQHERTKRRRGTTAKLASRDQIQLAPRPVAMAKNNPDELVEGLCEPLKQVTTTQRGGHQVNRLDQPIILSCSSVSLFPRAEPLSLDAFNLSRIFHPSDNLSSDLNFSEGTKNSLAIPRSEATDAEGMIDETIISESCQTLHITPEMMGEL